MDADAHDRPSLRRPRRRRGPRRARARAVRSRGAACRSRSSTAHRSRRPRPTPRPGTLASTRSPRAARASSTRSAHGRRSALEAVEAMRVTGDAGSALGFSAYELGERALAWIVEERALRAALVPRLAAGRGHALPPAPLAGLAFGPSCATATLEDGTTVAARLVVGADGLRSWVRRRRRPRRRAAALRPDRGRRQLCLRAAASRHRPPVVPARRRHPRVAAAARAAASRSSGRRPTRWRTSSPHSPPGPSRSASPTPASTRWDASSSSRRLRAFRCTSCACRRPSRTGWRWSATPRMACTRSPGRASTWASATPRRWRRCWPSAARSRTPARPILLERYARRAREPVAAMQTVTDGLARLFGAQGRWVARLRNPGLAAVDRLPLLKRAARATCAALSCLLPPPTTVHGAPSMNRFLVPLAALALALPARARPAVAPAAPAPARAAKQAARSRPRRRRCARSMLEQSSRAPTSATWRRRPTSGSTRCSSTTSSSTPTRRSTTCSSARCTTPRPSAT